MPIGERLLKTFASVKSKQRENVDSSLIWFFFDFNQSG